MGKLKHFHLSEDAIIHIVLQIVASKLIQLPEALLQQKTTRRLRYQLLFSQDVAARADDDLLHGNSFSGEFHSLFHYHR